MCRPAPEVLMEISNKKNYDSNQIYVLETVYAIHYDGQLIGNRLYNQMFDGRSVYTKTTHSSRGHAMNQARKFNERFNTDKFEVYAMTKGAKQE